MINPKKRMCSFRLKIIDTIPKKAAEPEATIITSKIEMSEKPTLDKR